ncbi:unnamed protein product [Moneuplotes crassus]|uniref:Uncharacterized protein n=1 Tax=Euplotes crassus TaxID=5936 RepID=A0AAD1Y910_EUPCR|nr:unnamed protein product [Moneuplotes crassus]
MNMNNSRYSFHMNATEESKIDEHTLEDYSSSEESVSVSKTNSTSQFQEQNNLTKKKSEISMGILYSSQLKDKKAIYSGESFGKKPDER